MYRYKKIGDFIQAEPEILIYNGNLDFKELSKLYISYGELKATMCEHGIEFFKDVKLAMPEANRILNIISDKNNLRQSHYKR